MWLFWLHSISFNAFVPFTKNFNLMFSKCFRKATTTSSSFWHSKVLISKSVLVASVILLASSSFSWLLQVDSYTLWLVFLHSQEQKKSVLNSLSSWSCFSNIWLIFLGFFTSSRVVISSPSKSTSKSSSLYCCSNSHRVWTYSPPFSTTELTSLSLIVSIDKDFSWDKTLQDLTGDVWLSFSLTLMFFFSPLFLLHLAIASTPLPGIP